MKPLFLLDAYGTIYRSYFAFISKPLRNPEGENVSAVYGFFRTIFQLWDNYHPEAFAAVFDSRVPTFRHEEYALYKANRQKTPEDLHSQVPMVEEILEAMNLPFIRKDRFEADDIIASLAKKCCAEGRPCYIISADKDLLQLVGDCVYALRPDKEQGFIKIGSKEVISEWGVEPEKILDYLSLTGDSSDNVPGVPGVGDKTALKLLNEFGSFDNIFANLDKVKPQGLQNKLKNGKESADLSRHLITLASDIDLELKSLDDLAVPSLNREKANPYFIHHGMRSLVKNNKKDLFTNISKAEPSTSTKETFVSSLDPDEKTIQVPESYSKQGQHSVLSEATELEKVVSKAEALGIFAFDCETDSLDEMHTLPVGFSIATDTESAVYVPVENKTNLLSVHQNTKCIPLEDVKRLLKRLFDNTKLIIVGQNLKFDMHIMENFGLSIKCQVWDTMIAAWLCDPERDSLKLENLGSSYLGFSGILYKDIAPKGTLFSEIAIDKAAPYAAEDAYMVLRLKTILETELAAKGLKKLFSTVEMPLLSLLVKMEREGIMAKKEDLDEYGKELDCEIIKTQNETYKLLGHEFNLNSPKQLQEVLFTERKLKTGKKTKTGYSTDISVLEDLAKEDPVPELILKHRTLQKLKSTYVDSLLDLLKTSDRIHTHFIQTGTATGRLSSRDPNLQNIPVRDESGRRIRKAFCAKKGYRLISADYAQIELVVFAHLSGDEELQKAFIEGKDVHKRTAALIFGKDEKDVLPEERRAAKTINFGVIYGMSAFRLASELGISRTNAQKFIDEYFIRYKGVASYIEKILSEAREKGSIKTILGRTRPIRFINSKNATERQAAERVAVNTPIQGSAADIVKIAMILVDKMLAENFPDSKILLQVHDELIIEAPENDAEKVAKAVEKVMTEAYKLSIPLRVGIEQALTWGEMH